MSIEDEEDERNSHEVFKKATEESLPFWKEQNPWVRGLKGFAFGVSSLLFGYLTFFSFREYQHQHRPLEKAEISRLEELLAMKYPTIRKDYGKEWEDKFVALRQMVGTRKGEELHAWEAFEVRTFIRRFNEIWAEKRNEMLRQRKRSTEEKEEVDVNPNTN